MHSRSGKVPTVNFLDIYDDWVRDYVRSAISKYGIKFKEIQPNIDDCIKKAKEDYGSKYSFESDNPIKTRYSIATQSIECIRMIVSQKDKFTKAKSSIRSYGAFILAGAGISYSSDMPLSEELQPIIKLCMATNYSDLRADIAKLNCFKENFLKLCSKKQPNESHMLIARNFQKYIKDVVTLNWDNLLERALKKVNKKFIVINREDVKPGTDNIWKFHGDVEFIVDKHKDVPGEGGWVLPGESEFVFDSFSKYYETSYLKTDPYVIVILGYREKDGGEICSKVINKLLDNGKRDKLKVSMDIDLLHDEMVLVGSSDYILAHILPNI